MSIYNERYLSFSLEDVRSIFSPFAGYINDLLKQKVNDLVKFIKYQLKIGYICAFEKTYFILIH